MKSLFRFLVRNHVFLLFLVLEAFSLVLIFNYNNYQRVKYFNTSNQAAGVIFKSFNSIIIYFKLARVNEKLAAENTRLRSLLLLEGAGNKEDIISGEADSGKYTCYTAKVINNSINKQYNYLTLNKGTSHGILRDQGIISENGVVGIVNRVSENYATGISLLNRRLMISGKLKKNDFFGSVSWDGKNYRYAELTDIPTHASVATGDSVVTRGSSTYFPEGILIGTVESFEIKEGESFYTIKVKLSVDFKSLTYVDVIENNDKNEIIETEAKGADDKNFD